MKIYLGITLLFAISCIASETQRKHIQQQKPYKKELPYAVVDNKQVIIIQNPKQDGHVHTIKRSLKTIEALYKSQVGLK